MAHEEPDRLPGLKFMRTYNLRGHGQAVQILAHKAGQTHLGLEEAPNLKISPENLTRSRRIGAQSRFAKVPARRRKVLAASQRQNQVTAGYKTK
jgi:hypothetical protein